MTPRAGRPRFERRSKLERTGETAAIVEEALATFEAPRGWTVLRAAGQLDAQWRDPDGHWARFSVRFSAREAPGDAGDVLFERPLGTGTVTVTFDCSDLDPMTIAMAKELLTPLQRILARAAVPGSGTSP